MLVFDWPWRGFSKIITVYSQFELKELNGSGEKKILKAVTVLLLPVYHVYFPLKYGVALHLIPSQKMPCVKFG